MSSITSFACGALFACGSLFSFGNFPPEQKIVGLLLSLVGVGGVVNEVLKE